MRCHGPFVSSLCPLFLFVGTFVISFLCLVRRHQSRLLRALLDQNTTFGRIFISFLLFVFYPYAVCLYNSLDSVLWAIHFPLPAPSLILSFPLFPHGVSFVLSLLCCFDFWLFAMKNNFTHLFSFPSVWRMLGSCETPFWMPLFCSCPWPNFYPVFLVYHWITGNDSYIVWKRVAAVVWFHLIFYGIIWTIAQCN